MFKAWNIIDADLHAGSTGHQYWEAKALADELLSRGVSVRIFPSNNTPAARFPGISVYPTFSPPFVSENRVEKFVVRGRNFHRDLSRIEHLLFLDSLSYFPNISEPAELLAIIRWLMHFRVLGFPESLLL